MPDTDDADSTDHGKERPTGLVSHEFADAGFQISLPASWTIFSAETDRREIAEHFETIGEALEASDEADLGPLDVDKARATVADMQPMVESGAVPFIAVEGTQMLANAIVIDVPPGETPPDVDDLKQMVLDDAAATGIANPTTSVVAIDEGSCVKLAFEESYSEASYTYNNYACIVGEEKFFCFVFSWLTGSEAEQDTESIMATFAILR